MSPASVHGGALGRWFEELCRVKVDCLRDIATKSGGRLVSGKLPVAGGIYAFWWMGALDLLQAKDCHRHLTLRGPGRRPVRLEIDDEWLGLDTELPVPLYVGKNASNIATRIGQHLRLGSKRVLALGRKSEKGEAPTTSCQLRAGVDHLFPETLNTRDLVLDNVGLSYVVLDGDRHAANRFYLEDLAIGLMRPPFNVDVER